MSSYDTAGVVTGHNVYILRSIVNDMVDGYVTDANEHRHIAASRADLEYAAITIARLVEAINTADTSRVVSP